MSDRVCGLFHEVKLFRVIKRVALIRHSLTYWHGARLVSPRETCLWASFIGRDAVAEITAQKNIHCARGIGAFLASTRS